MKMIKRLAEMMAEEIEDSEHYAKEALYYKDTDRTLAEMFRNLANQELDHADQIHKQAVRLIDIEKRNGTDVPAVMQSVWDWEHERMVNGVADVRIMLDMFNRN